MNTAAIQMKSSCFCDDAETPRRHLGNMDMQDSAMQNICTSLMMMGPCANLAKARATATHTDLQRDDHLVIAVNKAGQLQRSASTRIDDDADRIKLLGIDITYKECPNGNNRHAATWEKVQKTAAMARRCYTPAWLARIWRSLPWACARTCYKR